MIFSSIKYTIVYLLIIVAIQESCCQTDREQFPQSWIGTWTGDLEIYKGLDLVNSIPMSLKIDTTAQSDRYAYFINYGMSPEGLRPYYLHVVDSSKGQYILDEANGIRIEMYKLDNQLFSSFQVMGSLIQTVTHVAGDVMHYTIYAGSSKPISITGDTIMGADTIPPVETYSMPQVQKAILKRTP